MTERDPEEKEPTCKWGDEIEPGTVLHTPAGERVEAVPADPGAPDRYIFETFEKEVVKSVEAMRPFLGEQVPRPDRPVYSETYSGIELDVLNPQPEQMLIEDIAHALSNLCRYSGHSKHFYSVAQHSVFVHDLCPPEAAFWGLMHDAAEAYLSDITSPVKQFLPEYRWMEERYLYVIAQAFGLPWPMPVVVKAIDLRILRTEHRDVMNYQGNAWAADALPPLPLRIRDFWAPETAKYEFLEAFKAFRPGRDWTLTATFQSEKEPPT